VNVVVIVCDTLRMDDFACLGNPVIQTPTFDALKAESTFFSNYYAEGLPTVPVRTAYFTGRYTLPFRPWGPLRPDDVPIAEILWDQGYNSALVTDTYHLHNPKFAFGRGFDYVQWVRGKEDDPWIAPETVDTELDVDKYYIDPPDGNVAEPWGSREMLKLYMRNRSPWGAEHGWQREEDHFEAQVVQGSIDWLAKQVDIGRKDRLFLWCDIFAPHDPIDPPPPYDHMYGDPPAGCKDLIMPLVRATDGYLSDEQLEHVRRVRWGFITFVDAWVGRLVQYLRDNDMLDNTLLVWTTDHGDFYGEHGIIEKCRPWPYDILSHIPLLVRHPEGLARGKTVDAFTQTPDLMPTLLEALKVPVPEHVQGESLLPLMTGDIDKHRDFAISGWHGGAQSIRDERWSFIKGTDGVVLRETTMELYDRQADPGETNNLFGQHPDVAEKLNRQLEQRLAELSKS